MTPVDELWLEWTYATVMWSLWLMTYALNWKLISISRPGTTSPTAVHLKICSEPKTGSRLRFPLHLHSFFCCCISPSARLRKPLWCSQPFRWQPSGESLHSGYAAYHSAFQRVWDLSLFLELPCSTELYSSAFSNN